MVMKLSHCKRSQGHERNRGDGEPGTRLKGKGKPASARTKEIAAPKPMKTAMKAFECSSSTNENPIMTTQKRIATIIRSIWPVPNSSQGIDKTTF